MSFVVAVISIAFGVISVILLPGAFAPPAATPAPPAAGTGAPPTAAPAAGGGGGACKYDPFPTPTNCEVVKETIKVAAGATFDGKDKCYTADKALGDGGQGEGQKPIIEVADGGTVSNVVFGKNAADGIHCLGSCKIIDTWWTDVGEDAATFKGKSSQVSIQGGGAANASDKVFQHNGGGSVEINCFQCNTCGKLYRSCGNCKEQFKRTVSLNGVKTTNITADLVAINPNYGDTATIKNLTMVGGSKKPVCLKTEGNDTKAEPKKMGDGPDGKSCIYTEADIKTA